MNQEFHGLVEQLPVLMQTLINSSPHTYNNMGKLPEKGVYVFYENENPIYVGRTNRMKDRLKEHGRLSSGHNKAPFAFNLAKKMAADRGIDINKMRSELENDTSFSYMFTLAKERISKMSIKVIKIEDPIVQTIFEVYASLELGTSEFNSFNNH